MFASPVDAVKVGSGKESAQWLHRPHVTPIDRYYGFRHLDDVEFREGTQANWTMLGMLGSSLVDPNTPPSNDAHQLTTSQTPPTPMTAHEAVVKNEPAYWKVWNYLLKLL